MEAAVEALLKRAFHTAPAIKANDEIAKMREAEGTPLRSAVSYEVLLPQEGAVAELTERVMPRLVYFLACRGLKLPKCPGIFASIFAGDQLYFIRGEDLLEELSKMSGLTVEEMVQRHGPEA
jgi:hypothetical protein